MGLVISDKDQSLFTHKFHVVCITEHTELHSKQHIKSTKICYLNIVVSSE